MWCETPALLTVMRAARCVEQAMRGHHGSRDMRTEDTDFDSLDRRLELGKGDVLVGEIDGDKLGLHLVLGTYPNKQSISILLPRVDRRVKERTDFLRELVEDLFVAGDEQDVESCFTELLGE